MKRALLLFWVVILIFGSIGCSKKEMPASFENEAFFDDIVELNDDIEKSFDKKEFDYEITSKLEQMNNYKDDLNSQEKHFLHMYKILVDKAKIDLQDGEIKKHLEKELDALSKQLGLN